MLYENPRGIGCVKCHGKNMKGKEIYRYKIKNSEFILRAPNISNVSWKIFYNKLKQNHRILTGFT